MTIQTPKLELSNNQLFFGGPGGGLATIGDVGGQELIVYSGENTDSIQIGNTRYGGVGGGKSESFKIPNNGQFILLALATNGSNISFLRIKNPAEDAIYEFGGGPRTTQMTFGSGIMVKFSGIYSGAYIDALLFDMKLGL